MSPRTLTEWEERLRPEVEDVDLLGEVLISREESLEIGRLIGELVHSLGWQQAEKVLEEEYPCSFAVYLVSQGIYGYEEGNYWEAVRENTGLPLISIEMARWGQLFERIVRHLEVVQFPDLGGHRYVGPILAHGGIPDYCLSDFFEQFIHPLVSRPEFAPLSTPEFLMERLSLPSISAMVNKPILRFLRYGGKVAEDFVERCRKLALRTAEEGVPPAPEAVGLPRRVVEAYSEWLAGKPRVSPSRRRAFRSPVLFLDPWGWGVCLHCPRQSVLAADAQVRVLWRIRVDGELAGEIPVEVHREEFDLKSAEESVPLRQPAEEYQVELVFVRESDGGPQEEVQRVWGLPGISEGHPLMLFAPETGRAVIAGKTIGTGSYWVLHPSDVQLRAEPEGSLLVREQLPRLPWGWSDYVGSTIDLRQGSWLTVARGDVQITCISVVETGAAAQPTLEGGQFINIEDGRPPLYTGHPPAVKFRFLSAESRLHRWHVEIRNEWPARPKVRVSSTLDALKENLTFREDEDCVLLELGEFLGHAPMGNYRVSIRGPLGRHADLAFRILPHLEITGHEELYLPGALLKHVTLLLETSTDYILEVQPGAKGCEIRAVDEDQSSRFYEVMAEPEVGSIPLRFVGVDEAGEPVYVPLTVPLRRLRWMVVLRPEEALASQWRTVPALIPFQAVEQSLEPYVFVDLFGGTVEGLSAKLCLEGGEGVPVQEQPAQCKPRQRYIRFDLTPFLDTLRHAETLRLAFQLVLEGLPGRSEPFGTPIAWITKRFVVEQVSADGVWNAETATITLRWQAAIRVRHRLARLWPMWRLWEPPLEVQIPDEVQGEYSFSVPASQLRPGKYLVEFDVRDPWSGALPAPTRPAVGTEGVFPVCIPPGVAERRLEHLTRLEAEENLSFADVLEQACIRRDLGHDDAARADFQWCFEHLDDAEFEHVLALAHCISSEQILHRALRMKVAAARQVKRLLRAYDGGEVSESLFREYLSLLPRHTLLPAETCRLLLSVDDEKLRIHAVEQLLRRDDPTGVRAVMEWVKAGEMSDDSALSLLAGRVELAASVLEEALPHPAVVRLLERLGRQYPGRVPVVLVRPGYWVRCAAGWGRLERIETFEGEEVPGFFRDEQNYRLYVTLRAQSPQEAEQVVVDLRERTVTFTGAERIYTCTKCGRFSSVDPGRVEAEHEPAAHEGVGPRFRIVNSAVIRQSEPLEYSFFPPEDPWL